jgi:hypothetical protein
MITVMIEPDNWLTKARQGSRHLAIRAGLSDKISIGSSSRLKTKSSRYLDENVLDTNVSVSAVLKLNSPSFFVVRGLISTAGLPKPAVTNDAA